MLRCCRHGMTALERHARRSRGRADPVQDQQQGKDEAHGDGHGAKDTASPRFGLGPSPAPLDKSGRLRNKSARSSPAESP